MALSLINAKKTHATTLRVEDLLEHVQAGLLRVPTFQRGLKWRSTHVRKLFDSIYRGFPIGSLLLAVKHGEAERLSFGPVTVDAQARDDAWFIVDGQQRVTALAGTLLHPDAQPLGDAFAIWFDLEAEVFVRRTRADDKPTWLPLNLLSDSARLLTWLSTWPLRTERPELFQRAMSLSKALREYALPVYLLDGSDQQALRLIFNRVNTAGVGMEADEVFNALYGEGEKPLAAACGRLAQRGFGRLPEKLFLRAAKVLSAAGRRSAIEPDGEALDRTEAAMARTIDFLQREVGIPHRRLLPYRLPLLVLPRFFDRFAAPAGRTRQLLARWVWRGALGRTHGNSSDVVIRQLVSGFEADEAAAVEHLLASVAADPQAVQLTSKWNTRFAASRLFAIGLLAMAPRAPDGAPLTFEPSDWDSVNTLIASLFVEGATSLAERLLMTVKGRALSPRAKTKMVQELQAASPDVWASHALDQSAVSALAAGDRDAFVAIRARLLAARLDEIFAAKAGTGQTDRVAIRQLIERARAAAAS